MESESNIEQRPGLIHIENDMLQITRETTLLSAKSEHFQVDGEVTAGPAKK
jgi:hypothetical protein